MRMSGKRWKSPVVHGTVTVDVGVVVDLPPDHRTVVEAPTSDWKAHKLTWKPYIYPARISV